MNRIPKELWALIAPSLDQALDLDAEGQAAVVDRLRSISPAAADELTAILRGETSLGAEPPPPWTAPPGWGGGGAGRSIGAYTLQSQLGRGGMGTVWLARRTDGLYDASVAIKLLNLTLDEERAARRFTREARALGRLSHPHVARLLDAGVAQNGQPFLVLEHVDGVRIDRYAEQQGLSLVERIRLVIQVLDGAAAAHANLVVHRDIKPSNILVDQDGSAKLLDFGIATLLHRDDAEHPQTLDDAQARALTPEFAAPEIAEGQAASAATDVYSAAVLLYTLLSGRHPTGEGCETPAAYLRALSEVEPSRLSQAWLVGPEGTRAGRTASARRFAFRRALGRRDPRDLDTVMAKALKKAPAERYATAAEFRDDLRRLLEHQPVRARPDTAVYRARKFGRRHWISLTAAGATSAVLLAATVVSLSQLRVAQRERDRAQDALRRSDASVSFEANLFRMIEPGEALTYRQLLDRGRDALEKQFQRDPIARMQVGVQFAQNYLRDGDSQEALEVLARTVEIADSADDALWRARTRCELAIAALREVPADSIAALIKQAQRWLERAPRDDRGTLNACDQAAATWNLANSRPDSAAGWYKRVVDRVAADGDSASDTYLYALADYARASYAAGRYRDVLATQIEVVRISRAGASADPQDVPIMEFNAYQIYRALGEHRATLRFVDEAMRLGFSGDTIGGHMPMLRYFYGETHDRLRQGDSAQYWYEKALERPEALGRPRAYLAERRLARMARAQGAAGEAARHEAAAIAWDSAPPTGPNDAGAQEAIARLGRAADRGSLTPDDLQAALAAVGYSREQNLRAFIDPLREAALALLEAGLPADAAGYADHLVRVGTVDSLATTRSGIVGEGLLLAARAAADQRQLDRSRDLAQRALAPLTTAFGARHPLVQEARSLAQTTPRSR